MAGKKIAARSQGQEDNHPPEHETEIHTQIRMDLMVFQVAERIRSGSSSPNPLQPWMPGSLIDQWFRAKCEINFNSATETNTLYGDYIGWLLENKKAINPADRLTKAAFQNEMRLHCMSRSFEVTTGEDGEKRYRKLPIGVIFEQKKILFFVGIRLAPKTPPSEAVKVKVTRTERLFLEAMAKEPDAWRQAKGVNAELGYKSDAANARYHLGNLAKKGLMDVRWDCGMNIYRISEAGVSLAGNLAHKKPGRLTHGAPEI